MWQNIVADSTLKAASASQGGGGFGGGGGDWSAGIGAGISSAGSLIGQLIANRANRNLQQNQLDWNERMWHMQNQYNLPSAQMQRMKDAGLHPLLALEGMGGGNSPAPPTSVQPAQMENTMKDFDPFGKYLQLKNASAQIENIESDTELKKKEGSLKEMDLFLKNLEGKDRQITLKYLADTLGARTDATKLETEINRVKLYRSQIDINHANQQTKYNSLRNQREEIALLYDHTHNVLMAANSYEQLQNTIIGNLISYEDWKYMHKHKAKMPVHRQVFSAVARALGVTPRELRDAVGNIIGKEPIKGQRGGATKDNPIGFGGIPFIDSTSFNNR
jgi:hypothetical protein